MKSKIFKTWIYLFMMVLAYTFICEFTYAERRSPVERNKLPILEVPPAIPVSPDYIIEPPDTIVVNVQGESGSLLGGSRLVPLKVRPDGKITIPLLGEIYIMGMTPEQASKNIAAVLSKYIRKPNVSVEVVTFNSKKVYITGAVGRQTSIPFTGQQTVLDIVLAAGYERFGARNYRIRLIRPDPYHPKTWILDINKLLRRGYSKDNIYVQANDVIYVEPTFFRAASEQTTILLSPFAPLISVGQRAETMWDLSDRAQREL